MRIKLVIFIGNQTHGSVSAAKKPNTCKSVLFTGRKIRPILAYCNYKTIGAISIKFTYVSPTIYQTHGSVSAAKKPDTRKSVLFTGRKIRPILAYCNYKTIGAISIKFTYVSPTIYRTSHTKFERNGPSSSRDMNT